VVIKVIKSEYDIQSFNSDINYANWCGVSVYVSFTVTVHAKQSVLLILLNNYYTGCLTEAEAKLSWGPETRWTCHETIEYLWPDRNSDDAQATTIH
jgi:hypothetical protein